jgi:hypothetical protein
VFTGALGWVVRVLASGGSIGGAWATDHAPSRSKKSSGLSWYFEYMSVCTRKRSSG